MSKNNSTISVPNPKLRVICPISVIIASKDLDLERVSSAWLGSAEQGTNDKEWVMEPARKMCRTKNDNENLTLKHISFTFCSLFRVEIIKTSNKLTVFDIQWLHFVGRGAFPNARPRRLSADVCVLELEDNNPKTPKRSKTFAVFPFFASPKKPRVFFLGFSLRPGVEGRNSQRNARMVASASASLLVASFVGDSPRWRFAAWSASSGSP